MNGDKGATSFACLLGLALVSCTSLKARVMARASLAGLESIESYRGRTVERGLIRRDTEAPIVKSIAYAKPWRVRAEVLSPAEHAGETFVFDGTTISVWWPRSRVGLRIRGVENPARREVGRALLRNSAWVAENYDFTDVGAGKIAGREVEHWRCEPRSDCRAYDAWLDRELSLPLAVSVDSDWYRFEFTSLDLTAAVADDEFRFEFPKDALLFDCDLSGKGVSFAAAQESVEFPLLLPDWVPAPHKLDKVVVGGNDAFPIVALIYPADGRWLSISETPNVPGVVPDTGVPVKVAGRDGMLNFAFGFTIVSWAVDNTALTLIAGMPYAEALSIAEGVKPASAK